MKLESCFTLKSNFFVSNQLLALLIDRLASRYHYFDVPALTIVIYVYEMWSWKCKYEEKNADNVKLRKDIINILKWRDIEQRCKDVEVKLQQQKSQSSLYWRFPNHHDGIKQ